MDRGKLDRSRIVEPAVERRGYSREEVGEDVKHDDDDAPAGRLEHEAALCQSRSLQVTAVVYGRRSALCSVFSRYVVMIRCRRFVFSCRMEV